MELSELKLTDKRLEICRRLDLKDSDDILRYYPFKYERNVLTHYEDFIEGERVAFEGELISYPNTFRFRGKLSRTTFKVLYEEEEITVTIFNRPWIKSNNNKITIIGRYEGKNKVTASNFYTKDISEILGINPIYSLKDGIKQNEIRKLIEYTFKKVNDVKDYVPQKLLDKHGLCDLKSALYNIHFPTNELDLKKSLARLKYEEFLRFYLSLEILSDNNQINIKDGENIDQNKIDSFINSLSYTLTVDQKEAIDDILKDLRSNKLMYRLLQGEVGSGKTLVSMIGLYANYLSGYQGALMAPTEILAKQHLLSFKETFNDGIKIELLVSGNKDNVDIKKRLKDGDIDIVIGTHALFQEDVSFKNLGLVITDEQHRFGVKQRKALKEKGENVDFLLMSATPIPRTLASSLYGNMDISTIKTLPSGRKGCDTYLINKNSIVDILPNLKEKLDEGRQIYLVASSIEASDSYGGKDVTGLYNSLIDVFKPYKVGLLHGKMTGEEKDEAMEKFNNNEIQILVSTTVIEVGVNVKNATVMVIYDADRFGLSQLHQLRGRVQRGDFKGTCYLLTNNKDSEVKKRLNVLADSNDGFKISEEDLKLRGPGDILGTRQSGLPTFILGDIFNDTNIIEASKDDVKMVLDNLDKDDFNLFYLDVYKLMTSRFQD